MTNRRIVFLIACSIVLSVFAWTMGLHAFHFDPYEWKSLELLLFCTVTYLLVTTVIVLMFSSLKYIASVSIDELKYPWKQIITLFIVLVGSSLGIIIGRVLDRKSVV